jgi:plasmid stability protein
MGDLSIRNLDDEIHAALRLEAARAGVSVEEQARRAIAASVKYAKPTLSGEQRAKIIFDMQARVREAVGPGRSLVDEFLLEKREEARREYED